MMDFMARLPKDRSGHDVIWVIVDKLTKSSYFLAIKITDPLDKFVRTYIREIVRLHRVSVSVMSNRVPRFTSRFWKKI